MTPLDIFWIFFMAVAILPAIKQRMLESSRLQLMHKIEKMRGSRVIALIHREETMSLLGFPVMRYIDINDSEEVIRAIKMTDPSVPIDFVLHTPGGLVLAAEQIANALANHPAKVTVVVPHYAMSGGTLIALAADEILMDENAVLGPIDPQLGKFPAASVLKVVQQKGPDKVDDETLIMADIAEKAMKQVRQCAAKLLSRRLPQDKAEQLADLLSRGEWTHDYPITFEQAKELGLPVNSQMPTEFYQLMNLYPQPAQRRPSVQYIPAPHRSEPPARGTPLSH